MFIPTADLSYLFVCRRGISIEDLAFFLGFSASFSHSISIYGSRVLDLLTRSQQGVVRLASRLEIRPTKCTCVCIYEFKLRHSTR